MQRTHGMTNSICTCTLQLDQPKHLCNNKVFSVNWLILKAILVGEKNNL